MRTNTHFRITFAIAYCCVAIALCPITGNAQKGTGDPEISTICGTDDRVPSNHAAIGRITTVNCTGWITANGLLVTAGHCADQIKNNNKEDIIEFNVPPSYLNGTPRPSEEKDRYVIDESSIDYENFYGTGAIDWAVFRVFDNPVTGLQPIQAQDAFFELTQTNSVSTIQVTGFGKATGVLNYTQQTHSITSPNPTNVGATLAYMVDTEPGNSGSPIIDSETGKAIGVHTDGGCPNSGTSTNYGAFWDALHPNPVGNTLTLDQRRESNQQMTGSTIGSWSGSSFTNYSISGTLPTIQVNYGALVVLRGGQNLLSGPTEKFSHWIKNGQVQINVANHRGFIVHEDATYISRFQTVYNATVNNIFPEALSAIPSSNQVFFKDPWLIDYPDPNYGNNVRNRGVLAPFKPLDANMTHNVGILTDYKGVFLNQSGPPQWSAPYYTVRAPSSVDFGGGIGSRQVSFLNWTASPSGSASFQNPGAIETPVVFHQSNATVSANLKGSRLSSFGGAYRNIGQRNIVRSHDGWLHMVYESMGHVWYEIKPPNGDWQFVPGEHGALHLSTNSALAPSITATTYDKPNMRLVLISWSEGTLLRNVIYEFKQSTGTYGVLYERSFTAVSNARPITAWGDAGAYLTIWKSSSALNYRFEKFQVNEEVISSGVIPGTTLNSNSQHPAVSTYTDPSSSTVYYDIAWEQHGNSGPPNFHQMQAVHYLMAYSSGLNTFGFVGSHQVVSTGTVPRNKGLSITSLADAPRIGWVTDQATPGQPNSALHRAILRNPFESSASTFDSYVRSVSVSRTDDASNFYLTWSQIYDQPPSVDNNKFILGSSPSQHKVLDTSGWILQLVNGATANDMFASSFYPKTQPFHWLESTALGSYLKEAPSRVITSRGVQVETDNGESGYLELSGITVGGMPIEFVPKDESSLRYTSGRPIVGPDGRIANRELVSRKEMNSRVEANLVSEPFFLTGGEIIALQEKGNVVGLGGDGKSDIRFIIELQSVDRPGAAVRLREAQATSDNTQLFNFRVQGITEGEYRLAVRVEAGENAQLLLLEHYEDWSENKYEDADLADVHDVDISVVTHIALEANFPNPFNPSTVIGFQLPEEAHVSLQVYDVLGRLVTTLVNGQVSAGRHQARFDATHLASGMYIYRLQVGGFVQSKTMFLIK